MQGGGWTHQAVVVRFRVTRHGSQAREALAGPLQLLLMVTLLSRPGPLQELGPAGSNLELRRQGLLSIPQQSCCQDHQQQGFLHMPEREPRLPAVTLPPLELIFLEVLHDVSQNEARYAPAQACRGNTCTAPSKCCAAAGSYRSTPSEQC